MEDEGKSGRITLQLEDGAEEGGACIHDDSPGIKLRDLAVEIWVRAALKFGASGWISVRLIDPDPLKPGPGIVARAEGQHVSLSPGLESGLAPAEDLLVDIDTDLHLAVIRLEEEDGRVVEGFIAHLERRAFDDGSGSAPAEWLVVPIVPRNKPLSDDEIRLGAPPSNS